MSAIIELKEGKEVPKEYSVPISDDATETTYDKWFVTEIAKLCGTTYVAIYCSNSSNTEINDRKKSLEEYPDFVSVPFISDSQGTASEMLRKITERYFLGFK